MTQERSRQLGQALMAIAGAQVLVFLLAAGRRSYAAVAIPVGLGVAAVSAVAFWIGYTMATTNWDAPPDYGTDDPAAAEVAEAEGAPPPETLGA